MVGRRRRQPLYVVTRLFYGKKTLAASTTSYRWTDSTNLLDLRDVRVHPEFVLVEAMRGAKTLTTFSGGQSCPSAVFVSARGSGQNPIFSSGYALGLGSRGLDVWDDLLDDLHTNATNLPAIAVDYPASAVAIRSDGTVEPGNFPGPYKDSVDTGVADTKLIVARSVGMCPAISIVLFGYSQGAQVVGNAYSELSDELRDHIVRVILFADPQYRPDDPRVGYYPLPLSHHGIKGTRSAFPGGDAIIESWCWDSDIVCQGFGHGTHFHGPIFDGYEGQAAQKAADELPFPPRTHIEQPNLLDRILNSLKDK